MSKAMPKSGRNKTEPTENWPSAFKAVALSAVAKGQLVDFGILVVPGIFAWNMESRDVLAMVTLFAERGSFSSLGWMLFVGTAFGMTWLARSQRKMYLTEIERISHERDRWQSTSIKNIQPSEYEPKL